MSASYQKFAGACALVVSLAGLVYLISLVVLRNLPTAMLPSILWVGWLLWQAVAMTPATKTAPARRR